MVHLVHHLIYRVFRIQYFQPGSIWHYSRQFLRREAAEGDLRPYLQYASEPIVSSDVIGNEHSAVFDSLATIALPGGLVKTVTWYDNGWGYASRILDTVCTLGSFIGEEGSR